MSVQQEHIFKPIMIGINYVFFQPRFSVLWGLKRVLIFLLANILDMSL